MLLLLLLLPFFFSAIQMETSSSYIYASYVYILCCRCEDGIYSIPKMNATGKKGDAKKSIGVVMLFFFPRDYDFSQTEPQSLAYTCITRKRNVLT